MLLLLNDEDGKFVRVPDWSLSYALAGGVLMDLALEDRIDTDLEKLVLVSQQPVGDDLLDPTLADIVATADKRDARFWVERTAAWSDEIRERALARLVKRGILETRDDRFLWVFRARRYPLMDGRAEREVKLRIMEVLLTDILPAPRDVVIVCLADACGLFRRLLSKSELQAASERIDQVRKLDLIGQATTQAIRDIELSLAVLQQQHAF